MRLTDFDYELPEERIAAYPTAERDASRLLVVKRDEKTIEHTEFSRLDAFLRPGDVLVLNNSKVLPARLWGEGEAGQKFEILLIKPTSDPREWTCLVRPGRRVRGETKVKFANRGEGLVWRVKDEEFQIRFTAPAPDEWLDWLFQTGKPPLPPYIKREAVIDDNSRYQTVYAKDPGSVAAPTAGLHFSEGLLEKIKQKGVHVVEVTLHVGYGTFSPVRSENLEDHKMHEESFSLSPGSFEILDAAKQAGRRIIPVGTTSLRTLESIPKYGLRGSTDIFITPGHTFQWAQGLVTNFHLPKSTLYILVCAFLGMEPTRRAYAEAIQEKYRFFSYGDAMLIL